jgi:hypothetical protein
MESEHGIVGAFVSHLVDDGGDIAVVVSFESDDFLPKQAAIR